MVANVAKPTQPKAATTKPKAKTNARRKPPKKGTAPEKPKVDFVRKDGGRTIKVFDTLEEKFAYNRYAYLAGILPGSPEPKTVGDGIQLHLSDIRKKMDFAGRSKSPRESAIKNHLTSTLSHVLLADFNSEALRDFEVQLIASAKKTLIAPVMFELRCVFRHIVAEGWLRPEENPFLNRARPPKAESRAITIRKKQRGELSLPTLAKIKTMLSGDGDPQQRLVVALMLLAGLRGQEVRALTWRQVLFDGDQVGRLDISQAVKAATGEVSDPKTRHGDRFVPIHGQLYAMLKEASAGKDPDEWVVPGNDGEQATGRHIYRLVHRLQVGLGIGYQFQANKDRYRGTYGPHLLRHACVAIWIWSSVPDSLIRRWIGHSEAQVTLTFDVYGYLFTAFDEGVGEWPQGTTPHSEGTDRQIELECA